ncbi:cytochrome c peroxidase [Sulfuricurvum sp. MLSB]|uniref:cytochrome-c peroxidase n=1 Tax=Sulfuricurvum sp. MLSB TaxID=1537917 RepID=UPI000A8996DF|nr:cytochrome c peroxidase [Sulfuricurvum sp. MLSB]
MTSTNKYTKEMIHLGEKLFFEKNLSLNRDISCASCHDTKHGGADGRSTAIGHKGQKNPSHLNTPTVLNTVFSKHYFWDGRSRTLQDQAKGPLQAPFEMASTPKLIEKRLRRDERYPKLFNKAFGDSQITFERTAEAISAYENTLVTRGRYDRFLEGDLQALNREEKEGLKLFIDKGCIGCHNGIGLGGQEMRKFPLLHHPIWSMTDQKTINKIRISYLDFLSKSDRQQNFSNDIDRYGYLRKNLGEHELKLLKEGYFQSYTPQQAYSIMTQKGCYTCHTEPNFGVDKTILKEKAFAFKNTGGFLGKDKPGRYFRAPLLRNVVQTAPYFHNGKIKTLEEAVKIMITYQSRSQVNDKQIVQLTQFLKAVDAPE